MKISKRQLRRIIKKEKVKLLRESVADMRHFEEAADKSAERMSDLFYNDMMKLYEEEPDFLFVGQRGAIEKDVWEQNVVYASQELKTSISFAIAQAIKEIEVKLHDGRYHRR